MTREHTLPNWPELPDGFDPSAIIDRREGVRVGAIAFVYDEHHRTYRRDEAGRGVGGPVERFKYRAMLVSGETKVSWLLQAHAGAWAMARKVPKRDLSKVFGLADVNDALWLDANCFAVARAVERVKDRRTLEGVTALIGFEPKEPL